MQGRIMPKVTKSETRITVTKEEVIEAVKTHFKIKGQVVFVETLTQSEKIPGNPFGLEQAPRFAGILIKSNVAEAL